MISPETIDDFILGVFIHSMEEREALHDDEKRKYWRRRRDAAMKLLRDSALEQGTAIGSGKKLLNGRAYGATVEIAAPHALQTWINLDVDDCLNRTGEIVDSEFGDVA